MDERMVSAFEFACQQVTTMVMACVQDVAASMTAPHIMYRPALSLDGNKWCALLGENLMVGVAGFGASPEMAMHAFDVAWRELQPGPEVTP